MNFALGDVLLNRFRLVDILRDEPGFSVWTARDNTLQRSCQIFIVANSTVISRVNAAASYLALSQDPHFVDVLHLHRDGEVCVIVTDADPGLTLREYLSDVAADPQMYPLSLESIRSILGETVEICQDLDNHFQAHYCLDDLNIRLTNERVVLANFPVSAALLPPTAPRLKATNHDVESVMVYQIAAVAFELLTRMPYKSVLASRARQMLHDAHAPEDLTLICTRALGLPDAQGRTPIPLVTLLEMSILMEEYKPLRELTAHPQKHLNVAGRRFSAPSISQAVLKRVDSQFITPIPGSLRDSDQEKSSDRNPAWSASELIFGGRRAVDMAKPDTSTDLFHALGELDAAKLERVYDPYDFNDFDPRTQTMDTLRPAAPVQAVESSEKKSAEKPASYEPITQTIPPVFVPQKKQDTQPESGSQSEQQKPKPKAQPKSQPKPAQSTKKPKRRGLSDRISAMLQSRVASITAVVVILVALVAGAVYSLGIGRLGDNSTTNDPWSQLADETVRFPGQENNKGANPQPAQGQNQSQNATTSDDTAKLNEKKASAVPQPAVTQNTTPIEPTGYTFLNRPAGIRSWGYSFAFDQPHTFWRVDIANETGGGQVHIFADPTTDDPRSGKDVAQFTFANDGQTTSVTLNEPVQAQRLVVWIDGTDASTLPQTIKMTKYAFY
ncbi:hypothetical protein [Alloscardovia macacae]|uniref:Protein kinase domain-containing protein n=1 Tax=Alloscardovia macacae TaxID=1160091 RepID=A0A261F6F9_9BIFI|nr:hypothetical protein [Alloscardovia macacae]OZG54722.1 hypothetical protein ALMA_0047 [Alloscardovia macacae]